MNLRFFSKLLLFLPVSGLCLVKFHHVFYIYIYISSTDVYCVNTANAVVLLLYVTIVVRVRATPR